MKESDLLPSIVDYEEMIYTIKDRSKFIETSTLVLVRYGATLARVKGSVVFTGGMVLNVVQVIDSS